MCVKWYFTQILIAQYTTLDAKQQSLFSILRVQCLNDNTELPSSVFTDFLAFSQIFLKFSKIYVAIL